MFEIYSKTIGLLGGRLIRKAKNSRWFKGLLESDSETLHQLLHSDVTLGFVGGSFGIREKFLTSLKEGSLRYHEVNRGFTDFHSHGIIGIVTGAVDLNYQSGTAPPQVEQLSYTAIYMKVEESCKMLAWQSSWRNKSLSEL